MSTPGENPPEQQQQQLDGSLGSEQVAQQPQEHAPPMAEPQPEQQTMQQYHPATQDGSHLEAHAPPPDQVDSRPFSSNIIPRTSCILYGTCGVLMLAI